MDFAVMNYDYVNVQTSMEPYEVWFKLKDGASVQEFYDSIDKAGIKPLTLESASQQTIEKKNDPMPPIKIAANIATPDTKSCS